jgi:hypothetical protein
MFFLIANVMEIAKRASEPGQKAKSWPWPVGFMAERLSI